MKVIGEIIVSVLVAFFLTAILSMLGLVDRNPPPIGGASVPPVERFANQKTGMTGVCCDYESLDLALPLGRAS